MTAGVASGTQHSSRARIERRTLRTDGWWRYPAVTFTVLFCILGYLTWAVLQNSGYYWEPYLSPMFSPCVTDNCVGNSGWGWFPSIAPASPALLLIAFVGGFRVTCYYYRKAYYRSFWQAPTACAVPEPHGKYTGETRFPLIMQNAHRYFWYITWLFGGVLTYDVVIAFRDHQGNWGHMGLGTLILLINIILIWGYQLSCHSCRHIFGGKLKHFSKHPVRYRYWKFVSALNGHHMRFAWASLVSITISDIYIRLLSAGFFSDPRFF
jgi:hypothetical protein